MEEKKKNIPKRRFKEFQNADAWEQRELGEVVKITMGQSPNSINYTNNPDDYILVQGNADMKNGFVHPKVWTTQITKTAEVGDIILSVRAPVGDVAKTDYDVVLGRGVASIKGNQFIFQLLKKYKEDGYWKKISTGSTFESINSNIIKEAKLSLPSTNEQIYLGNFFNEIDQTITLHQRKLDKYKAIKESYLQVMFPAEGQRKPKRRFPGFTEDWEQRELGEIVESFEYGLNAASKEYDGTNKYLRITDIDDENRLFKTNNLTSPDIELKANDHYLLKNNDILLARTGASVGKSYKYDEKDGKVYFAGFLIRARINIDNNVDFIFQNTLTKAYENFVRLTSQRSGQPGINANEYKEYKIFLPKQKEQNEIGLFFRNIDQTITLHQKKLYKLKKLKEALLEEMFV
ncbi:restriction endonuclease subunit S [Macrococcus equi]|uniref:restriction endonuclease subunit S n=1 Tax=Macrococcus equi TaxID=3395462 RepID=UPI0039BE688D